MFVQAAVVDDLYTIELEVEDQSTRLRLDTFKNAFSDLIVKVSGSPAALSHPGFVRARNRASRYVSQFSYQREELTEGNADVGKITLKVEFSQKPIEALLRGNGFPVWGKVRPSVLIVMSKQFNKRHVLVSEKNAADIIEVMDKLSVKHGLPTQFPLLDLEDRSVLNLQESALDNLGAINDLAFRYQSDVVLIGELIGISGQGWKGVWQSQFSGQVFEWEHQSSNKENVMSKAMAHLAKLLAQEYALGSVKENKNTVEIYISNINSLQDYLTVLRYFSSLAVVEKTQVKTVTDSTASFNLNLRNSPDELHRLIELGDVIEQVDLPIIDTSIENAEDGIDQDSVSLTYRFL